MNQQPPNDDNLIKDSNQNDSELKDQSTSPIRSKKRKNIIIINSIIGLLIIGAGIYFIIEQNSNKAVEYVIDESDETKVESLPTEYTYTTSDSEYPLAYSRFFVIDEYQRLPVNYQNGILKFLEDNDKRNDGSYFVSRIPSRAKNIYCFGNFTGENNSANNRDIAFIAEYFDYKTSRIVIMNANGDLLFTKEYSSLPIINSFRKGSKVYIGSRQLVRSNYDGIIIKEPNTKYAIIYDGKSKQFIEHYQYTEDDLREYEEDYQRENYDECIECPDEPEETNE